MIFKIEQVRTNFNMVWMATENSINLCTAVSPLEKGCLNIIMDYPSGEKHRLYYNPSDTSHGTSLIDRLTFKLFDGDNLIGTVVGQNKKVKGFLQSYPYRVLKTGNEEFFLYEVGFGSKGLFLCIYKGDELIAIADKDLIVINYQDKYTVYSESSEYASIIMTLIMHYDITAHGDMMEISLASVKKKKVNTIQKELIAKYDSSFIPKIKAYEGIE